MSIIFGSPEAAAVVAKNRELQAELAKPICEWQITVDETISVTYWVKARTEEEALMALRDGDYIDREEDDVLHQDIYEVTKAKGED